MDVVQSLKDIFKRGKTRIDNGVFQLHYKASLLFLLCCAALVSARQYFGDPITCQTLTNVPDKLLDTYCWIHSTFSIPTEFWKAQGQEVPYPGVGKHVPGGERVFHAYYQWVAFVLIFQALLFYLPHYLWKMAEGGKMSSLTSGLEKPILDEEDKKKQTNLIVNYMHTNLNGHGTYSATFFFCEFLNFINVIGQIFLMDQFLDGQFTTYGPKVVQFAGMDQENRSDPMIRIFPRMTKCNFYSIGRSGDIQKLDTLCILPLNIINEKIYIAAWFWFVTLAAVTGICLIYRFVVISSPSVRLLILQGRTRLTPSNYVQIVATKCSIGDWFVFLLLTKNMEANILHDFIVAMARKLQGGIAPRSQEGESNNIRPILTPY